MVMSHIRDSSIIIINHKILWFFVNQILSYMYLQAKCNKWKDGHIVRNTYNKYQPQCSRKILDIR